MRLKINKACDLSSISVLPPQSRRPNPTTSGAPDPSVFEKMQTSQQQHRGLSQQSFSQGMSLSQLSQNSFDDVPSNDQRLGSQDQSTKRMCSLPPITALREDSQMVTRASNNMIQRWGSSSVPERRFEDFEQRFGSVESSLSRFGRILDSIQNDAIQINKTVKEVMLEVESIRQKAVSHENSLQLVLKAEEDIRSNIDRSCRSCLEKKSEPNKSPFQETISLLSNLPDKIESRMATLQKELFVGLTKEVKKKSKYDKSSFQEIFSLLSSLPGQIESRMPILHEELSSVIRKEMKEMMDGWKPPSTTGQSPSADPPMAKKNRTFISNSNLSVPSQVPIHATLDHKGTASRLKPEPDKRMSVLLNKEKQLSDPKPEVILLSEQDQEAHVIVELDEEMDSGFSCLFDEKQTGGECYYLEEANEETMRILKKARRRKRKFNNNVIHI